MISDVVTNSKRALARRRRNESRPKYERRKENSPSYKPRPRRSLRRLSRVVVTRMTVKLMLSDSVQSLGTPREER
jgi:hypothetical protein